MHWEYKTYPFLVENGSDFLEHKLNEIGDEGWELVGIFEVKLYQTLVFKRPKD